MLLMTRKKPPLEAVTNENYKGHLRVSIVDADNLHYEFLCVGFVQMEDTDIWSIFQKDDVWPVFMIPAWNIKHVYIEDLQSSTKIRKEQSV